MLTKEDIAAFRKATHVSFSYSYGESSIDAILEKNYKEHNRHRVAVGTEISIHDGRKLTAAHCSEMYAQQSSTWMTVAHLLKPGDELWLWWGVNGYRTENHRRVDFHADSLSLLIRPKGAKKRDMKFLLKVEVGPDNTARMCKTTQE